MDFYESMLNTAGQCGINILSDDYCCKLLAWVYIYGGDSEKITYNKKLRADIKEAQKRFNIYGGHIPDYNLLMNFKKYVKECGDLLAPKKTNWVLEIEKKYNLNKGAKND